MMLAMPGDDQELPQTAAHLLTPLDTTPMDARMGAAALKNGDTVVYRMGLRSMPVLNLPDRLDVGGVRAELVDGPVLAQFTHVRQRPGLPIRFDKHMVHELVGAGERILVLSVVDSPLPDDVEAAFLLWRSRAQAAAGTLATVLDERVAGDVLFEDAIVLANGTPVGALDMRERIRTFLPLEVTALDQPALATLTQVPLGDGSGVARAARLYRRAALEGPTADAYVMLWVAAESLLDTPQPRKVDLDAVLAEAGMDPDAMPLHTGLLIGLRGKIVHEGLEDHERLRMAYYEMEAVVRVLIRRAAGIQGGWWPAHGPAMYDDPWPERMAHFDGQGISEWHDGDLPPVVMPGPERVPRSVPVPDRALQVVLSEDLLTVSGQGADIIAGAVSDALAWLVPDDPQPVMVDVGPPADHGIAVNTQRVLIPADRLDGLLDQNRPEVLVNLVWDLHGVVGALAAIRAGIESVDDGVAVIEAVGAWHQYHRLVIEGGFDATILRMPTVVSGDMIAVGKLAGWAAAGDPVANSAVNALGGRDGELARDLVTAIRESPPSPPRPRVARPAD
jgi:hypothetical protein